MSAHQFFQRCGRHVVQAVSKQAASSSCRAFEAALPSLKQAVASAGKHGSYRALGAFAAALPTGLARQPMNMGFAAASTIPKCSPAATQLCGMATDAMDGSGEGEGASDINTSSGGDDKPPSGEDDDEDHLDGRIDDTLYRIPGSRGTGEFRPTTINMLAYSRQDIADPFELMMLSKEAFMRKDARSIAIPPAVREVMYQHRWDKLLVDCRRTVDRTPRGKAEQYTAMVVVGNMKGLVGIGVAAATTQALAVSHAHMDAYNKLTTIPLYRSHTLYHSVDHKYHGSLKMRIWPRPDGWGVRTNDLLYEVCRVIGLRNVSIKVFGRRKNKFFVVQCLLDALQKQSVPYEGVEGTGVYVRELGRGRTRKAMLGAVAV